MTTNTETKSFKCYTLNINGCEVTMTERDAMNEWLYWARKGMPVTARETVTGRIVTFADYL